MDALAGYGSTTDSDCDELRSANITAAAAGSTHNQSQPLYKKPRPSNLVLPSPLTSSDNNMVQWSEDYLTAKLEQAASKPATTIHSANRSVIDSIARKPANGLTSLAKEPEFTNPHHFQAVADALNIKTSLAVLQQHEGIDDGSIVSRNWNNKV
jgi:hypothetical protein